MTNETNLTPQQAPFEVKLNIIPTMDEVIAFKNSIIDGINSFLFIFSEEHAVWLLLILSILLSLIIRKHYNIGYFATSLVAAMIFFSIRFLGIGG